MEQEKDLSGLSDAELDTLIEYGINQQETVPKHGKDYQHYLNVVANGKEEKAKRGSQAERDQKEGSAAKAIADEIPDTKVEGNPLSANAEPLHLAPDATDEQKEAALEKKDPDPVNPDAEQIPADTVDKGLPGVVPGQAETTPENQQ